MLTLNDGRIELYQWDTGRKLSVAVECTQVHYSNKVFGRSIDVDVVDGVAIIPDILLQTDKELTAWAFVGTPENGYTKISKTFKVSRRNKPADYVFTPPEQTTLGELVERLQKIEETQDPDAIKNAVEDYLEKNPVEAPVKSVNGKTGKIELSAEDVGAISQDKLQEATNEALAQAKASGEFDGKPGMPGKPGDDGITPHIGDNGNWFIGDTDTGKPSRGKPGPGYELTDEDRQEIAGIAAGMVPGGGGGDWTLLFDGTIEVTEPVRSINVSLLASCEGMTEIFVTGSWTANANTESGNDNAQLVIGRYYTNQGGLGDMSNNQNFAVRFSRAGDYEFVEILKSPNSLASNNSSITGVVDTLHKPENSNYDNLSIHPFAMTYQGTITLTVTGR